MIEIHYCFTRNSIYTSTFCIELINIMHVRSSDQQSSASWFACDSVAVEQKLQNWLSTIA